MHESEYPECWESARLASHQSRVGRPLLGIFSATVARGESAVGSALGADRPRLTSRDHHAPASQSRPSLEQVEQLRGGAHASAGVNRIANLFHSARWSGTLIKDFCEVSLAANCGGRAARPADLGADATQRLPSACWRLPLLAAVAQAFLLTLLTPQSSKICDTGCSRIGAIEQDSGAAPRDSAVSITPGLEQPLASLQTSLPAQIKSGVIHVFV